MPLDETCSVSEFAALRGFSDSYARRLRRAGRLVLDSRGEVKIEASILRIAATAESPGRGSGSRRSSARCGASARSLSIGAAELAALDLLVSAARAELGAAREQDAAELRWLPGVAKALALLCVAEGELGRLMGTLE